MTYRTDFLVEPTAAARPRFETPATVNGEFWIYYHLAVDGSVLYIGKTSQPRTRTTGHANSTWFADIADIIWFGPMDEVNATAVERELIAVEQPPNNVRHTDRDVRQTRVAAVRRRIDRLEREIEHARETLARLDTGATA